MACTIFDETEFKVQYALLRIAQLSIFHFTETEARIMGKIKVEPGTSRAVPGTRSRSLKRPKRLEQLPKILQDLIRQYKRQKTDADYLDTRSDGTATQQDARAGTIRTLRQYEHMTMRCIEEISSLRKIELACVKALMS